MKRLTSLCVLVMLLLGALGPVISSTEPNKLVSDEGIQRIYVIFTSHIDTGFDHPMDEMRQWVV